VRTTVVGLEEVSVGVVRDLRARMMRSAEVESRPVEFRMVSEAQKGEYELTRTYQKLVHLQ